jgi:hypothetical protein
LLSSAQIAVPGRDPAVAELLSNLPEWFRRMGTDDGISAVEQRCGASIPASLRLFYQFPAIGCWLRARHDTDIFLETYPPLELPAIVNWNHQPHLVLAEFPHSQVICAVGLNSDNPQIRWGYDGQPNPFDAAPCDFAEWLSRVAADHVEP